MAIPIIVAFTFNLIVSSLIIYYLNRLEKIGCKCALNFKRDYIFYFTCINLFFALMNVLIGTTIIYQTIMLVVFFPLVVAGIVNIVYTIQYVNEMKQLNCDCSESIYRELMFILAIVNACAYILVFLLFIPIIIMYPSLFKKIVTNKQFIKKYMKNGRPNNAL
jgi:hypothetical protein